MAKFEALNGVKALVLSYIERDEKGAITRDQTIPFNQGVISRDYVRPANLITESEDKIRFLRKHKGNEANGGIRFREIVENQAAKPAIEAKPKPVAADLPKHAPAAAIVTDLPKQAVVEPEPVAEPVEDKPFVFPDDLAAAPVEPATASSANDYPEANTVQEASAVLRRLFPELTTLETNNKKKVFDVAASKNVTFSNLKP